MNEYMLIGAIALDLKRVAIGFHRGSIKMGEQFREEALKNAKAVNIHIVPYYKTTHRHYGSKNNMFSTAS